MEGGSLADVLHAAQLTGSGPLSELVIGKLAARVLASLNYLHRERHQVPSLGSGVQLEVQRNRQRVPPTGAPGYETW